MTAEREEGVTVPGVTIVSENVTGLLLCRQGERVFHVPRYHLLQGTALRPGHEADLVLPRWFGESVGLAVATSRAACLCGAISPAPRPRRSP